MSIIRPATPGFLVTLTATILLAIVTFSVPYFKSVYFLKASLSVEGISGSVTFGVLGYCLQLPNGTTCSKPSVGYQLDINSLVGDNTAIQIPTVVVKWITYALFLHAIALILAAGSAVFGLLAHVREMSMACCSTCISGFAAAVTLIAFIFDIALFFIGKSRINAVQGGSASIGTGIWLTLAAWILLFFAGCFYGLGRCCVSRRSRDHDRRERKPSVDHGYAESMRLDAVKAEADRKARAKMGEVGLPAFQEYEHTPLTKPDPEEFVEEGNQILPYNTANGRPSRQQSPYAGGYAQGAPGTRAVDDYYNASSSGANAYPPRRQGSQPTPQRQPSSHTQGSSGYAPSTYSYNAQIAAPVPSVPVPAIPPVPPVTSPPASNAQYLAPTQYGNHTQYPSATSQQNYGHTAGGTSYQSAVSHQQYPTNYSSYADPFASQAQPSSFNPDTYNNTGYMSPPAASGGAAYGRTEPDRSYTLGGGGYGANTIPELPQQNADSAYYPHYPAPSAPSPINTVVSSPTVQSPTSPRGPRPQSQGGPSSPPYEDSPPVYDAVPAQPPGIWGQKR
ncbi:pH-response regulator palI/RIM9 [Abortiporus biennis]